MSCLLSLQLVAIRHSTSRFSSSACSIFRRLRCWAGPLLGHSGPQPHRSRAHLLWCGTLGCPCDWLLNARHLRPSAAPVLGTLCDWHARCSAALVPGSALGKFLRSIAQVIFCAGPLGVLGAGPVPVLLDYVRPFSGGMVLVPVVFINTLVEWNF